MRRLPAPCLAACLVAVETACSTSASVPAHLVGSYGVYVTNEMSGDLTIVDPATNAAVGRIPLGKRARGIRSAPDGTRLFVALSGSPIAPRGVDELTLPPRDRGADGIGIVDLRLGTLASIVRGPSDPEQAALSVDGARLYVANEAARTASVIDVASGRTLVEVDVGGEPEGVASSPDGRLYVTSEEDNHVAVIDTTANRVIARIPVGARPRDAAFSPDGARAYVTSENSATISVVETASHAVVETIRLTGDNVRPMGVVVSPDGRRVYVTTGRGRTLLAIDATTLRPLGSVKVGTRPWGLAVSPDGTRLYTANGPSNDVSVVDAQRPALVATVAVGDRPWSILTVAR